MLLDNLGEAGEVDSGEVLELLGALKNVLDGVLQVHKINLLDLDNLLLNLANGVGQLVVHVGLERVHLFEIGVERLDEAGLVGLRPLLLVVGHNILPEKSLERVVVDVVVLPRLVDFVLKANAEEHLG